jgi:predicted deacylase
MWNFYFILLFIAVLIFTYHYLCNYIRTFSFTGKEIGPTVLLLGGTHGNEPAGSKALEELIHLIRKKVINISAGKVIIIPRVNRCGLWFNQREGPIMYDINRNYKPGTQHGINQQVLRYVTRADWVIDLHEGWGYHITQPDSLGSGVYAGNTKAAQQVATNIVQEINRHLSQMNKPLFVTNAHVDKPGSLYNYANDIHKNYILIETTGQNNIQPMYVRVSEHLYLLWQILWRLRSCKETPSSLLHLLDA